MSLGKAVVYFSEYGRPSHYDFAIDADGEDIVVGVSKCSATPNASAVCKEEAGSVINRVSFNDDPIQKTALHR